MRSSIISIFIILLLAMAVSLQNHPIMAQEAVGPKLFIKQTRFEFPPVFEGESVQYEFKVENGGTDALAIIDVETDWGCTAVSYPEQIPPGGEGAIKIELKTFGHGGKHITKSISVQTNDPHHPRVGLQIAGDVKKRNVISTTTVRLTGNAGQTIKETVIISPSEKNPFKITGIRMEKGENIRYDLSEIRQPDGLRYRITIYNTKKEKGWYIDKVFVKTSSQVTPEFKISVMGVIRDG